MLSRSKQGYQPELHALDWFYFCAYPSICLLHLSQNWHWILMFQREHYSLSHLLIRLGYHLLIQLNNWTTITHLSISLLTFADFGRGTATAHDTNYRDPQTVPPPPQWEIEHALGVYVPDSFWIAVSVFYIPFQLIRQDKGDKANGLMSTLNVLCIVYML